MYKRNKTMYNFMDCMEKSLLQGIATGGMARILLSRTPMVVLPLFNRVVPIWLFGGIIGFVSSHINDGIHMLIKDDVHVRKKAEDEASMVLGAVVGGLSFLGVTALMSQRYVAGFGLYNCIGVGAAGEIVGSFAYNLLRG